MRIFIFLLLLSFGCVGEPEAMEIMPPDVGTESLPSEYLQTLLATQHEWVAAGLPFPEECQTMGTRMTLFFDEWDELYEACDIKPYSAPDDWDGGMSGASSEAAAFDSLSVEYDPDGFGVLACIRSGDTYEVHFDNGLPEGVKHTTFAHEVIHGLQYCSKRGRDHTHLDIYAWETVLKRARILVFCGGRARFGEADELEDIYCFEL